MAIPLNKEHREIAKREGHFLFQLSLDGRHLTDDQKEKNSLKMVSAFEVTGALPDLAAKELWEWYRKWSNVI